MAGAYIPKEPGDSSYIIYKTLKDEIINLVIAPGNPLSENDVCKRFSVSRTPVRSAFQRLSDSALIKIIPYKETYVSRINMDHIKQLIYMRSAIESKVIRDFIDFVDPLVIEKLRYHLRRQSVLISADFSPADFYREDSLFHRIWFNATGKELLWRKIQHSQVHYTRFRMLDIVKERQFEAIVKQHEELFLLITQKNKDAIESCLTKHLNGGIERLGKRIYTDFSEYFEKLDR